VNVILKPLFGLKNVHQKHHKAFQGVADLPSFMPNLMQTRCSILAPIADKMKHEIEKALV
jgi:hypothetical protein